MGEELGQTLFREEIVRDLGRGLEGAQMVGAAWLTRSGLDQAPDPKSSLLK